MEEDIETRVLVEDSPGQTVRMVQGVGLVVANSYKHHPRYHHLYPYHHHHEREETSNHQDQGIRSHSSLSSNLVTWTPPFQ